jgi:AcrR family transcriptional regulator
MLTFSARSPILGRVTAATEARAETLRERKKRMTSEAIFQQAKRMFDERGYDNVTVAEIADAANISVKTLFTYIRSKEDLIFNDAPTMLDQILAAVRERPAGASGLDAVIATMLAAARREPDGIEGYHRTVGTSSGVHSRVRRMWEEFEDDLTRALAAEDDDHLALAEHRLAAAQLTALVRVLTSQEVRALIADQPTADRRDQALREWINHSAERARVLFAA